MINIPTIPNICGLFFPNTKVTKRTTCVACWALRKKFIDSVYYFPVVSGSATNLRVQIILHASVSLRFYFLGNFLGNLLKFLFQAHKHRNVRFSVLLLPYPPKVCLIACRTISQVPSRKWDLVRICIGIEAELDPLEEVRVKRLVVRVNFPFVAFDWKACLKFFTLHSSFFTFTLQSYYNLLWKSQSNIFFLC